MDPLTAALTWIKTAPKVAEVVTPDWDDPNIGGGPGGLAAWAEYQTAPLSYAEALAAGLIPPALADYYAAQASSTSKPGRAPSRATGDKGAPGRAPLPSSSGTGTGPVIALVAAAGAVIVLGGALGTALLYLRKG